MVELLDLTMSAKDAHDKLKKQADKKFQPGAERINISSGAFSRLTLARESRAMSAIASSRMTAKKDHMDANQRAEATALEDHLHQIQPFNGRWRIIDTISAGTYGVAFRVADDLPEVSNRTNVKAVIKVARSMSGSANSAAEWEAFVLEKMFRREPGANVVRILDKGMLQDQNDEALEFMALEFCDLSVSDYINDGKGFEHKERVCRVALDNMGMISKDLLDPVRVLYDPGMARMYTDGFGELCIPRTICPFRGTPEWASGHAIKNAVGRGISFGSGNELVAMHVGSSKEISKQSNFFSSNQSFGTMNHEDINNIIFINAESIRSNMAMLQSHADTLRANINDPRFERFVMLNMRLLTMNEQLVQSNHTLIRSLVEPHGAVPDPDN